MLPGKRWLIMARTRNPRTTQVIPSPEVLLKASRRSRMTTKATTTPLTGKPVANSENLGYLTAI